MNYHEIHIDKPLIAAFCLKHRISRLALFGSILTEDFTPQSDVDILVEFEPGQTPGFLRMAALESELTGLFGRRADIRTPAELSHHFRQDVLDRCEVQYG